MITMMMMLLPHWEMWLPAEEGVGRMLLPPSADGARKLHPHDYCALDPVYCCVRQCLLGRGR